MQAITRPELTGNLLHGVLIRHLRDHDFFDTTLFPVAIFVPTRAI